ncbi:hypothetical protein [Frederiksenia canicola]
MFSIIGFHTCEDRGETDEEIRTKVPIKSKPHNQWFGEGYYFWTDSDRFAKSWGSYEKRFISRFQIGFANQNDVFDLVGNAFHQEEFNEMLKLITEKNQNADKMDISSVFYFLREHNILSQYKAIKGCGNCYSVKGCFINGRKEQLMFVNRIQLCLFDKNVALTLENVIRHKEDSYEYVQS